MGWHESAKGSCALEVQLVESPLPELRVYTEDTKEYTTIAHFLDSIKSAGREALSADALEDRAQRAKVECVPISVYRGIFKGYKISDLEELSENTCTIKARPGVKTQPKVTRKFNSEKSTTVSDVIINTLRKNLKKPYCAESLSQQTKISEGSITSNICVMKEKGMLKVVGWDYNGSSEGPKRTFVQLSESPLDKLQIKKSGSQYLTIAQFWRKKCKGKVSMAAIADRIKTNNVDPTPVYCNKRVYRGYDVAELLEIIPEISGKKVGGRKKELVYVGGRKKSSQQKRKGSLLTLIASMFKRQ